MNPHRRTLLTSLALILPVIAQPAIAQQPTAESKPASKPKPKAKAKAEPAPPPPPAMPKEEVLATVKHTIAWANGQVYTAKLARGNIAMQRRIDAREPAGSEGEAPTQIRDEQARLEREAKAAEAARKKWERENPSLVEQVTKSPVFKDLVRTAGREIIRGLFGTGRRR